LKPRKLSANLQLSYAPSGQALLHQADGYCAGRFRLGQSSRAGDSRGHRGLPDPACARASGGAEPELRDLLDEYLEDEDLPIVIHHASERIGMDEKAAHAVRTKKDSSMRVGLKLVREKKVAGFVTAGNTGAAMATAKMVLGALPGVDRPALTARMPTVTGSPCVLLDVGANVDCKAHNLEQFAVMGEMFARSVLKVARPRVGLLSIGEEETKGNDLTREAFPLLKALPIQLSSAMLRGAIFSTARPT
jgi:fatty acid/phospholipid synthesis protein PlsX